MSDPFREWLRSIESPATSAFAITPDDDNDLASIPRAVYAGGAGDLVVILLDDTASVTFAVADALLLPIRVRRVLEASTATGLVGLL